MDAAVRIVAPAKVNLRLRVLARESTGYHGLETVFCAISLADELEVRRAGPGVDLAVEGAVDTGPAEDNLVVRAARRFYRRLGEPPAVEVRLTKRIPAAAGLGGGSSDAAATLRALDALHGHPLSPGDLLQCAIELGSDVPFFLCGSPLALGWSRGERLLALPPLPPRPVLVAHPGVAMPTGRAFRRIAERRGEYRPVAVSLPLSALSSWEGAAGVAENDFQGAAVEMSPQLGPALQALRDGGAEIALLSGSGASIFGVFAAESPLRSTEDRLRGMGLSTWRARTLEAFPAG